MAARPTRRRTGEAVHADCWAAARVDIRLKRTRVAEEFAHVLDQRRARSARGHDALANKAFRVPRWPALVSVRSRNLARRVLTSGRAWLFFLRGAMIARIEGSKHAERRRLRLRSLDAWRCTSSHLAECGGLPYAGDACGRCLSQNCCDVARDCVNDPACLALQECLSSCALDDMVCQEICGTSIVPNYDHADFQLTHCSRTSCADACQSAVCGSGLAGRAATCFQAEQARCDAEQVLWTDRDAVDWFECYLHCQVGIGSTDNPCGCSAAHSNVKDIADLMRGCFGSCLVAELGAPPDWSCIGKVQWPRVNTGSDSIEFRVSFADFQGLDPLPNLMVSQCAASDTLCNAPFGPGVTDANGTVTLTLKPLMQTTNAYFGYLLIQGATVPLYYFFPPPSEDTYASRTTPNRHTARSIFNAPDLMFDPSLGWLSFVFWDCAYGYASGVRMSSDRPEGRVVYGAGRLQDPSATETDSSGFASIINLQPGPIHIKTWNAKTGEQIGSAHLVIRGNGSCTGGIMAPTPLDD
jgi:hypothetical protein